MYEISRIGKQSHSSEYAAGSRCGSVRATRERTLLSQKEERHLLDAMRVLPEIQQRALLMTVTTLAVTHLSSLPENVVPIGVAQSLKAG